MRRMIDWVKASRFFYKSISLKLSIIYMVIVAFICFLAYLIIPPLFNYPPGAINTKFDVEVSYISYVTQFLIIYIIIIITGSILLKLLLRDVDRWQSIYCSNSQEIASMNIIKIRKKCMNAPYIIYIGQICVGLFAIIIILLLTGSHSLVMIYKILILVFSFATLIALVTFIFSKRIFTKVLLITYRNEEADGLRIGLRKQIFLQILPIIITSILFTSLVGYSRIVYEKSDLIFSHYKSLLIEHFKSTDYNRESIISELKDIKLLDENNDSRFIITPDREVINVDNVNFSDFFIKYAIELANKHDSKVYEGYAIDIQGVIMEVECNDGEYIIGLRYNITSNETIRYFFNSFLILLLIISLVLTYITNTLSSDISRIAFNLMSIAKGETSKMNMRLPVTSNDEIGDLVKAFNMIQDREEENIESIKEQQAILVEQERLASLGQLIGGIAHNLKTPIMSISGAIEAVKDLAYEYRDSIGDRSVTNQDHEEIAKEMLTWLDKMKPYCAYMSDVISAVKGQAVQMTTSSTVKFTVDEVVKRVELLLKHELKRYHCVLNVNSQIDMKTEIKGEVNNLVQVFDNIIINAMQAYDGENGTIDLEILRSGDNVEFIFKDYGKGIPRNVADRLFKEMITTKGKNGTGLGLYMSYSTIKGRFGGNMSFTTKEGCGTTFFISIPCITYGNEEAG